MNSVIIPTATSEVLPPSPFTLEPFLNVDEVATLLHQHPKTIARWARQGKIPCRKIGRQWLFRQSELNEWLDSVHSPQPSVLVH